jgi:NADPH:quinone reductase-like Zn-dependent oxidoreductase
LKQLGAHHIINYREDSRWGSTAKGLTPGSLGVDIVVDVGGNATVTESLKAVKVDGLVVMAGLLGTSETPEPLMSVLSTVCTVRGILLGSRKMMADMINFIGEHNIDLALDTELFALTDVKAAFRRLEEQKHFAKVVIRV